MRFIWLFMSAFLAKCILHRRLTCRVRATSFWYYKVFCVGKIIIMSNNFVISVSFSDSIKLKDNWKIKIIQLYKYWQLCYCNWHLIFFIFVSVSSLKRYDEVQWTCHLAPITKSFQVKVCSGLFRCSQLMYKKHAFLKSHKVSSRGHLLYLFSLVILQSHDCHSK